MRKYLPIVLLVVIFDQIAKLLIKSNFNVGESFGLIKNFLSITYVTNTGSAFGLLQGTNNYLIFFSLIVLGLIIYYWDKIVKRERGFYALVVGGIIGNLIDRAIYGYVVDFIAFNFWPAFNIADLCLSVGIVGLIILSFKE